MLVPFQEKEIHNQIHRILPWKLVSNDSSWVDGSHDYCLCVEIIVTFEIQSRLLRPFQKKLLEHPHIRQFLLDQLETLHDGGEESSKGYKGRSSARFVLLFLVKYDKYQVRTAWQRETIRCWNNPIVEEGVGWEVGKLKTRTNHRIHRVSSF